MFYYFVWTHPDTSHISFTYPPVAGRYPPLPALYPHPVTHLPIGSGYFRAQPFPVFILQYFSNLIILHLSAYEDGKDRMFRNFGI
jgi:hypothetical protein